MDALVAANIVIGVQPDPIGREGHGIESAAGVVGIMEGPQSTPFMLGRTVGKTDWTPLRTA